MVDPPRLPAVLAALRPLARMVQDEYPSDCPLWEMAQTWGYATGTEVAAIKAVEPWLEDPVGEVE